ncbi:hypothetical protein P245_20215 [Comamonas thiooxydans]|uniref:Uncharacterized protein n=1 Tax=Comamonas thiooxydans TaxID=363952 RepID=A0A0E3BCC4_9BURK|nr:hypothetical protein [Comamonas thiooxydans]KGG87391.1 hypothetical protein P245_20215 [Comamonas thiooxydans]
MTDYDFSINGLSGCNLNASSDREYIEYGIRIINERVEKAAYFVFQLQDGRIDINETTKNQLIAARATLLFYKDALQRLKDNSKWKDAVSKYYAQALEKNESNFSAALSADTLLKTFFTIR